MGLNHAENLRAKRERICVPFSCCFSLRGKRSSQYIIGGSFSMTKTETVNFIKFGLAKQMLEVLLQRGVLTQEQYTRAEKYCVDTLGVNAIFM